MGAVISELIIPFLGFIALFLVPIMGFTSFGWLIGVLSVVFTGGVIFLIYYLIQKAQSSKKNDSYIKTAVRAATAASRISIIFIILGLLMFLSVYITGKSGTVSTFTECGWCGGSGVVSSGKLCSLCNGGGGAYGSTIRFSANDINKLGFLLASIGTVVFSGVTIMKNNHNEIFKN